MAGFKSSSKKTVPAAAPVQAATEEKVKPHAYMIGAVKNGEEWQEALLTGFFFDAVTPKGEKLPEGLVQLRTKTREEIVIPAGAILKITLGKSLAEMGIKAVVNNDGDISIEPLM